jgi:hypothetical protein
MREITDRMVPGKRHRLLWTSPEMLVDLCKPGKPRSAQVVENALPDDAKPHHTVGIVVESAEFDPVADGEAIPYHPAPVFRITEIE